MSPAANKMIMVMLFDLVVKEFYFIINYINQ